MSARQTLKIAGQFDREIAACAGQQTTPKLKARIADWKRTVEDINRRSTGNSAGYHCPGSLKK